MENDLKVNRRQFIIGPEPVNKSNDEWNNIKMTNNLYLSHCKTLPVEKIIDQNKNEIYLIGLAVQTDPSKEDPLEELKKSTGNLNELYKSWAGRWVLLTSEELHMDISGLMGCFYTNHKQALWISNSVKMLKEILNLSTNPKQTLPVGLMRWYPLPKSSMEQINSLITSQILLIQSGEVRARELFPSSLINLSEEEALELIETSLINGLSRIAKTNQNLWIALSAGYDSRMLLAAAIKAGIPVKTYTMRKKNKWYFYQKTPSTSTVSKADMTLPPKIAKAVGIEHKWIHEKKVSKAKLQVFDDHTNEQSIENDRVYFAKGQWDWTTDNDAILLGQVTEVGEGFYYQTLNYNDNKIDKKSILNSFRIPSNTIHNEAINSYVEWGQKYDDLFGKSSIDWRNKFYLEQRVAGWLSSLQQGMDLIKGEKYHLINSQQILCALLALLKNEDSGKKYIKKLIDRMAPELTQFPFNPADPFIYGINKKISSASRHPKPFKYVYSRLKKKN